MSLANLLRVHYIPLSILLMKMLKTTRPGTGPWGTPHIIDLHLELEPLFTNKDGLVGDAKLKEALAAVYPCSDGVQDPKSREITKRNGFQKHRFGLFNCLLGRVHWDIVLEGRRVREDWLMLKHPLLQAQEWSILPLQEVEWSILLSRKSGRNAKYPAWMNNLLLAKLKNRNEK